MLLKSLAFQTGGQCTLTYEKGDGWLRATWAGYVNPTDALAGATAYLEQVGPLHFLYLLNDNVALEAPGLIQRAGSKPPGCPRPSAWDCAT